MTFYIYDIVPSTCGHISRDSQVRNPLSFTKLDELQPFVFHISDLCLRQQDSSFQSEGCDVGGDFACILLRFQCQDHVVMGVGNEPEGWEAVGGVQPSSPGHWDVAEISCAGQEYVGGAALISSFLVAFRAGTAWEEEPALPLLAPHCWLVYQITWGQERTGVTTCGLWFVMVIIHVTARVYVLSPLPNQSVFSNTHLNLVTKLTSIYDLLLIVVVGTNIPMYYPSIYC